MEIKGSKSIAGFCACNKTTHKSIKGGRNGAMHSASDCCTIRDTIAGYESLANRSIFQKPR